jgi:transketolase
VANILNLEPLAARWAAFGWQVREIDGHDIPVIYQTLATSARKHQPVAVIAHTVKGKGISFMENQVKYHSGLR